MIGKTLAHYKIVEKIGEGGMGEVYRATDSSLDRDVALKVLPAKTADDPDRRMRFEREAKAVASLQHPNIVTIHSVEQADGIHFLTMELVSGRTLGALTPAGGLPLDEFFALCIPLVDAVGAAHEKGVIHRDLKPSNVMVDENGRLKVLDFGLAKLTDTGGDSEAQETLATDSETQEGRILGTAAYMSPEQAEGKDIDHRSDIFSLGVLLYEMATRQHPFRGDSNISTITSILRDDPPSVTDLRDTLPRHLGRVIRKCLAKMPDRRYQSAVDLRNDLDELKSEIESGELVPGGDVTGVPRIPRGRRWTGPAWALGTLFVAAIAFVLWTRSRPSLPSSVPPATPAEIVRLTVSGTASEAAISPDGRYACYVETDEHGVAHLFVHQVATGSAVEIVPGVQNVALWDPTFSPDGELIYFIRYERDATYSDLYRVPVLGGAARLVVRDVSNRVSFSPDGDRFVYVRMRTGKSEVVVSDVDGSGARVIASRRGNDQFENDPSWSPDGSRIAIATTTASDSIVASVVTFDPEGESERTLFSSTWSDIGEVAWLPDGSGLVMDFSPGLKAQQLYELTYPGGKLRRITHDLSSYHGVGLAADGRSLVTQQMESVLNVWVTSANGEEARAITTSSKTEEGSELAAAGERIVFTSNAGDNWDLWVVDVDGGNRRKLTDGNGLNGQPALSPDAKTVVWASTRSGTLDLWFMEVDGGTPRQLTAGEFGHQPSWSPDGEWICYQAGQPLPNTYRIPAGGGTGRRLSETHTTSPRVSPDGTRILLRAFHEEEERWTSEILSARTGEVLASFRTPSDEQRWSPDGEAIVYVDEWEGAANLWRQDLDGGEPRRLTDFEDPTIGSFAFLPDGRIVLSRGNTARDIVLLRNFR